MIDSFLSQEEIDALLSGENKPEETATLSEAHQDALGEIGNISMGSAATTLSILLSQRVSITTPRVNVTTLKQLEQQYPSPYLIIEVGYKQGISGTNILAIKQNDALIIADLMMGGDGSNPPETLNDLYKSAISEAMNQMMGANATSMSTIFNKRVDIYPPNLLLLDFATEPQFSAKIPLQNTIVCVSFRLIIGSLIDTEIMQIMSLEVAQELVENLMSSMGENKPLSTNLKPSGLTNESASQYNQQSVPLAAATHTQSSNVSVQPVQFTPLHAVTPDISNHNIDLIMDVPLKVTVELGRTKKLVKDILEIGPGSVIELDKLAGEPVDVLVNGKLIAKGEVVVIDENFGVRITQIVSQVERLNKLQ